MNTRPFYRHGENGGKGRMSRFLIIGLVMALVALTVTLDAKAQYSASTAEIAINEANFPDEAFRDYVSVRFDKDKNGALSQDEINAVTSIYVSFDDYSDFQHAKLQSLKGVEHFTALTYLACSNNALTELDASKNTALTYLACSNNQLTKLDVSKNTALTYLACSNNQLTKLDVSKNAALTQLYCRYNFLTTLDISHNTALMYLDCSRTSIKKLDVSRNTALKRLVCTNTDLRELDISSIPALSDWVNSGKSTIGCLYYDAETTLLTGPSVPTSGLNSASGSEKENLALYIPVVEAAMAMDIDGSVFGGNGILYDLDGDGIRELIVLYCPHTWSCIYGVYTIKNGAVKPLIDQQHFGRYTSDWAYPGVGIVTYQGKTYFVAKRIFEDIHEGSYEDITLYDPNDFNQTIGIYKERGSRSTLRATRDYTDICEKNGLDCSEEEFYNFIGSLDIYWFAGRSKETGYDTDIVISPDAMTLAELLDLLKDVTASTETSGNISLRDQNNRTPIPLGGDTSTTAEIAINETIFPDSAFREYISAECDLDGNGALSRAEIKAVTSICVNSDYGSENKILSLKGVEYFYSLKSLGCANNQLTELDVSKNKALTVLNCTENALTTLDLSQNKNLVWLNCSSNPLQALDLSHNTEITYLDCGQSFSLKTLTTLDLSQNTELAWLDCGGTSLEAIDLSQNSALTHLDCSSSNLTTLDLSRNPALKQLNCSNSRDLTTVYINSNSLLGAWVKNNKTPEPYLSYSNTEAKLVVTDETPTANDESSEDDSKGDNLTLLIPVVEAAIEDSSEQYPGDNRGALYDLDSDGSQELILLYDTGAYNTYSVFKVENGTVQVLVDRKELSFVPDSRDYGVGTTMYQGKTYFIAWGDYAGDYYEGDHEGQHYEYVRSRIQDYTLYDSQDFSKTIHFYFENITPLENVDLVKKCEKNGARCTEEEFHRFVDALVIDRIIGANARRDNQNVMPINELLEFLKGETTAMETNSDTDKNSKIDVEQLRSMIDGLWGFTIKNNESIVSSRMYRFYSGYGCEFAEKSTIESGIYIILDDKTLVITLPSKSEQFLWTEEAYDEWRTHSNESCWYMNDSGDLILNGDSYHRSGKVYNE